jgi:CRISPR-associated protein Cas1
VPIFNFVGVKKKTKVNYYLKSNGILRRKENTIYFIKNNNDGQLQKIPIPIEKIFAIYSYGKVTLSSGSIHFLAQYNIPIHFFNKYGYKVGTFFPRPKKVSGRVLLAQVSHHLDMSKRMESASSFVRGALDNILVNMQYYTRSNDIIVALKETVNNYRHQVNNARTISELMSYKANATKVYYHMFDILLPPPLNFQTRSVRPDSYEYV